MLLLSLLVVVGSGLVLPVSHHRRTCRWNFFRDVLDVAPALEEALIERGVREPTAIQRATIGDLKEGTSGLLAAETGSGKSLAFLLPSLIRNDSCVVVLAPTRELALQLATEASFIVRAIHGEDAVELLAVGSATTAGALKAAKCIVATPKEAMLAFAGRPGLLRKLATATTLILDEVDALLPLRKKDYRTDRSKERAKKKIKKPQTENDAALFLRLALRTISNPDLQIIGASATASRATRDELKRNLKTDPYGRFSILKDGDVLQLMRPDEAEHHAPRSIVVPSVVTHKYAHMEKGCTIKRAMKEAAKVIDDLRPQSALVFLAETTGFTVGPACTHLQDALGRPVAALHQLLFDKEDQGDENRVSQLERGRRTLADNVAHKDAPVLVTFEASARGLHFDAVDLVLVVGLPSTPGNYLHLAGRTGRRLGDDVVSGTVVTLCPPKALPVLKSWSKQLGGVSFSPLLHEDDDVVQEEPPMVQLGEPASLVAN